MANLIKRLATLVLLRDYFRGGVAPILRVLGLVGQEDQEVRVAMLVEC